MTVICTDGVSVAADTLMVLGGERQVGHSKIKATRTAAGAQAILGFSGTAGLVDALEKWWRDGADPAAAPRLGGDCHWSLLVMSKRDGLTYYSDNVPYPLVVLPPFAIGSGADYAMGAMKHGASPRQAAEIACELCVSCGGPVQVLDLVEAEMPRTKIAGLNPRTGKQVIKLDRTA